jgi:hypothetical protein
MSTENARVVGTCRQSHWFHQVVTITREGQTMASLIDRITRLARSPQGQRLAERAQQFARDPNTRRKIEDLRARFMKKR